MLEKIGLPKGRKMEEIYRRGIDEGFNQGYWQAKKELEGKVQEIQDNTQEALSGMKEELKATKDQLNLLGRLVQQLSKEQSGLSKGTKETMEKILKVLEAEGKLNRQQ